MNPDGSGRTVLASGIDSWFVDWASGHRQFAWASVQLTSTSSPVYRVAVNGGAPEVVAGVGVTPTKRSPDGSWFAGWSEWSHWPRFTLDGDTVDVASSAQLMGVSW